MPNAKQMPFIVNALTPINPHSYVKSVARRIVPCFGGRRFVASGMATSAPWRASCLLQRTPYASANSYPFEVTTAASILRRLVSWLILRASSRTWGTRAAPPFLPIKSIRAAGSQLTARTDGKRTADRRASQGKRDPRRLTQCQLKLSTSRL